MAYLIERSAKVVYVTASLVEDKKKKRKIIIESRPEFVIVKLQGSKEQYPISWERVFEMALRHHNQNLLLEAEAEAAHKAN